MNYKILPRPVMIDIYRGDLARRISVNARRVVFSSYADLPLWLHRSTRAGTDHQCVSEQFTGSMIAVGDSTEAACQAAFERLQTRDCEWIKHMIKHWTRKI